MRKENLPFCFEFWFIRFSKQCSRVFSCSKNVTLVCDVLRHKLRQKFLQYAKMSHDQHSEL